MSYHTGACRARIRRQGQTLTLQIFPTLFNTPCRVTQSRKEVKIQPKKKEIIDEILNLSYLTSMRTNGEQIWNLCLRYFWWEKELKWESLQSNANVTEDFKMNLKHFSSHLPNSILFYLYKLILHLHTLRVFQQSFHVFISLSNFRKHPLILKTQLRTPSNLRSYERATLTNKIPSGNIDTQTQAHTHTDLYTAGSTVPAGWWGPGTKAEDR